MTRARTNSVFGEMISVSVPVTSCAESSSTDTLVSLGATPKATTRSAATTPPSLLTPVYHYQHPRHHMALSTVLGVFFGVLGTILLSLVIETRVGLHAIGDMTLPASTTTAPKSTSPVTTTAAPLSLTGCLTSVASVAVPLFGLGDSHGRDLLQSPLVRLGETHMDKERHWTRVIPLSDRQSNIRYDYHGTPRTYGIHTRHAPHLSPDTHILLSRGTWDLMKYSTPLSKYYAEVKALVRGAAATGAASVTFKTVHRFAAPTAELGFFAECTNADIVGAYRRVGACAVAAHNREAAAATSGERLQQVAVLDAWDATSRWPREAFADDGHHLVGDYLHTVADVFAASVGLSSAIPRNRTTTPLPYSELVWMLSDALRIADRFSCALLDPSLDSLETALALPARQGCRCSSSEPESLNDRCAFGRLYASLASSSRRFFEPHRAASALYHFVDALARAPKDHISAWHTNSTVLRGATLASGEAVLELCVNPNVSVTCLSNLGVDMLAAPLDPNANHTNMCRCLTGSSSARTSPWCSRQQTRLGVLARDLLFFVAFARQKMRPALPCIDVARRSIVRDAAQTVVQHIRSREAHVSAFLSVACTPTWQNLNALDHRTRVRLVSASLQAFASKNRAATKQATAVVNALRLMALAFEAGFA